MNIENINKKLPLNKKIKIKGRILFGLTKNSLQKIKTNYQEKKEVFVTKKEEFKNYFNNYLEEDKNLKIEEKIESLDEKQDELKSVLDLIKEEFDNDLEKKVYEEETQNEINRFENKKIKLQTKGLGVFSLSEVLVNKLRKDLKSKVTNTISDAKTSVVTKYNEITKEKIREEYFKVMEKITQYEEKTGEKFFENQNFVR